MFRFTAQGRIGRIQELAKGALRISVAAERIVEGKSNTWTQTEWLGCISFDAELNKRMLTDLEVGQNVTLEGRLVPRDREVDGKKLYDTTMEITGFQRGAKPSAKANGKAKPADAGADATA